MALSCVTAIGRCTEWLPMYATSTMVFALNVCWISKFQRSEYGLFISGFRKLTACPRKVESPCDEPEGCTKPEGNGLLSVAAGLRKLLLVGVMVVLWLKPSWAKFGLVE